MTRRSTRGSNLKMCERLDCVSESSNGTVYHFPCMLVLLVILLIYYCSA